MAINWKQWILEKNRAFNLEELKKSNFIEILEKQKYLPQYDTKELVKPEAPQMAQVPPRQKFLNDSAKAAEQGRIFPGQVSAHADRARADATRKINAQNQRAADDYKTDMNVYSTQADIRPKNVVSGHRLHGIDDTGAGSSVTDKSYQVMTDYPEHMSRDSHVGVKHAYNDAIGSVMRIKSAKNHVLILRRQGDNAAYMVHVTPDQYNKAMMTGWHDDSNKN